MQPYAVLAALSNCYPPLEGRSFIRYSPFRRSPFPKELLARLAWNKHVATVRSEPGSNPSNKKFFLSFVFSRISRAHTLVLSLFPFFQRSKISAKPKLVLPLLRQTIYSQIVLCSGSISQLSEVSRTFLKIFRFCFRKTLLNHFEKALKSFPCFLATCFLNFARFVQGREIITQIST